MVVQVDKDTKFDTHAVYKDKTHEPLFSDAKTITELREYYPDLDPDEVLQYIADEGFCLRIAPDDHEPHVLIIPKDDNPLFYL